MSEQFIKKIEIEGRISSEKKPFVTSQGNVVIIPICCREGWDSCIHVTKKPKKKKTNIGV